VQLSNFPIITLYNVKYCSEVYFLSKEKVFTMLAVGSKRTSYFYMEFDIARPLIFNILPHTLQK